ncbi:hypothetical protein MKW92_051439, partial [Papaver armeniacum]
ISDYPSFDKWLHWVRSDNEWVGEVLKKRQHWTYISVYAYFEKGEGYGGYGVLLRNALAKPLVASAKFSENGKSFFHQAFLGIKAGVKLAKRHKLSDFFYIQCNSAVAPALVYDTVHCANNQGRETRSYKNICGSCKTAFSCYASRDRLLVSLVMELGKEKIVGFYGSWGSNAAARFLAESEMNKRREVEKKGEKNKRHEVKKKEDRICPDDVKGMKPVDFPEELRNIIWKDASVLPHFKYARPPPVQEDSTM